MIVWFQKFVSSINDGIFCLQNKHLALAEGISIWGLWHLVQDIFIFQEQIQAAVMEIVHFYHFNQEEEYYNFIIPD